MMTLGDEAMMKLEAIAAGLRNRRGMDVMIETIRQYIVSKREVADRYAVNRPQLADRLTAQADTMQTRLDAALAALKVTE